MAIINVDTPSSSWLNNIFKLLAFGTIISVRVCIPADYFHLIHWSLKFSTTAAVHTASVFGKDSSFGSVQTMSSPAGLLI